MIDQVPVAAAKQTRSESTNGAHMHSNTQGYAQCQHLLHCNCVLRARNTGEKGNRHMYTHNKKREKREKRERERRN